MRRKCMWTIKKMCQTLQSRDAWLMRTVLKCGIEREGDWRWRIEEEERRRGEWEMGWGKFSRKLGRRRKRAKKRGIEKVNWRCRIHSEKGKGIFRKKGNKSPLFWGKEKIKCLKSFLFFQPLPFLDCMTLLACRVKKRAWRVLVKNSPHFMIIILPSFLLTSFSCRPTSLL